MAGRGISVVTDGDRVRSPTPRTNIEDSFEDKLNQLVKTKTGCFIRITLDYFSSNSDVQYYVDKVMDSVLNSGSSFMVEQVTSTFRLVTLLKTHGEEIKLKMFSKLQTTYQDIQDHIQENGHLNQQKRRNFCDFLGMLYFRFRLQLGAVDRYNVLAAPAVECMDYLLKSKREPDLAILIKLVLLNYAALCALPDDRIQAKRWEMERGVRHMLMEGDNTMKESAWLLYALDGMTHHRRPLEPIMVDLYAEVLGEDAVYTPPTDMLTPVPAELVQSHAHVFDVALDEYNRHRGNPDRPQDV